MTRRVFEDWCHHHDFVLGEATSWSHTRFVSTGAQKKELDVDALMSEIRPRSLLARKRARLIPYGNFVWVRM
jgi:hypothetical protein